MNYESLNDESLINEHDNLLCQKSIFEGDIEATLNALEDSKIDYMTKLEYNNDITYDKREIAKIDAELSLIEPVLESRNLLEISKVKYKNLIKK